MSAIQNGETLKRWTAQIKQQGEAIRKRMEQPEMVELSEKMGQALKKLWTGKASITPELVAIVEAHQEARGWSVKLSREIANMPPEKVRPYLKEITEVTAYDSSKRFIKSNDWPSVEDFSLSVFLRVASQLETLLLMEKYDLSEELRQWVATYAANIYATHEPPPVGYTYTPPINNNIPNDKIAHNINNATLEEWEYGGLTVLEKKKPQITSSVTFDMAELKNLGYTNLDRFDLFVLYTCISIQSAGNGATTVNAIYRAMTGKDGKARPKDAMREDIIKSVAKLMSLTVTIDAKGICEWYKYKGKDNFIIDNLLPARVEGATVNGVFTESVIFRDESPLVRIARAKGNQFLTYEANLLAVPINATRQNIVTPPYLLQRIEDTRGGKLAKTIVIDKVVEETGYTGERRRLVKLITDCFEYWRGVGYLKEWHLEKNGNKADKIKFVLGGKTGVRKR